MKSAQDCLALLTFCILPAKVDNQCGWRGRRYLVHIFLKFCHSQGHGCDFLTVPMVLRLDQANCGQYHGGEAGGAHVEGGGTGHCSK